MTHLLINDYNDYNNYNYYIYYNYYNYYKDYKDYKDYNYYNDYRDSDLDLDLYWGVVIYNQIVTWTAFAILAMFYKIEISLFLLEK